MLARFQLISQKQTEMKVRMFKCRFRQTCSQWHLALLTIKNHTGLTFLADGFLWIKELNSTMIINGICDHNCIPDLNGD